MRCNEDKIVYEDQGKIKVIKGIIIKEDEFIYDIQTHDSSIVTVGKRVIVQIQRKGGLQ